MRIINFETRQTFQKSRVSIMPDPKWHPKEEWHSLVRHYPKWHPKKNDTSLSFTKMTTQQNDKEQNDTKEKNCNSEWNSSEWQRVENTL